MPPDDHYLGQLQEHYARHRTLPSLAAIGELVGLRSKSSVAALVERLKAGGYLTSAPGQRLAPTRAFFARPLAETKLPAGFPSPATDALQDALSIDEYLVEHPSCTVLVTIQSDSMTGKGIYPGDIAVVEKRAQAKKGEIIVAIVDNEFTLKTLARDRQGYYLQPANPKYQPIRPQGELRVFGVLTGLIRKYPQS
jgi:repressor LexA